MDGWMDGLRDGWIEIRSATRDSQQPTSPIGFPIFETSATALCGTTTGKIYWNLLELIFT